MISVREKTVGIYVASSISDKISGKKYHYMKEERLLQVGAALTNERISSDVLVDCTGDNISEKITWRIIWRRRKCSGKIYIRPVIC